MLKEVQFRDAKNVLKSLYGSETTVNLFKNDGKRKVWRTEGTAGDLKVCVAANRTGSFAFIDDVTADKNGRTNSYVCKPVLSAQVLPNDSNFTGWHFTEQMDNDLKHILKMTQGRKVECSAMAKAMT